MRHCLVLMTSVFFLSATQAVAIDFSVGNKAQLLCQKSGWLPTGEQNSLDRDRTLFKFIGKSCGRKLTTVSEATNIHNHFKRDGASRLRNYVYSGQMWVDESGGGIGVTLYSNYPREDAYYRLRRTPNSSFEMTLHPDERSFSEGDTQLDVTPEPGKWYKFKIWAKTQRNLTKVRSKVWEAGTKAPKLWQSIVIDDGADRRKKGAPGVWSMGTGLKRWRRLTVRRR